MLELTDDTWLMVLTGAGVSAESGVPTFRDAGGLWEGERVEDVATPEAFERDPLRVWRFYSARREAAGGCAPNPGHLALAEAERRLGERFLLVTQNVDRLHRAAGNENVVELHGQLFLTRCAGCPRPPFEDRALYDEAVPECDECAAKGRRSYLRPHIVWFGEALSEAHFQRIGAFLDGGARQRLVFLQAGTSGAVYPAAGLVNEAAALGAETWLVNAEQPYNGSRFEHFHQGRSGEVLPRLLGVG